MRHDLEPFAAIGLRVKVQLRVLVSHSRIMPIFCGVSKLARETVVLTTVHLCPCSLAEGMKLLIVGSVLDCLRSTRPSLLANVKGKLQ